MTRTGAALLALSAVLAIGFGFLGPWATTHVPTLALALMKASGIAALAALAFSQHAPTEGARTQGARPLGAGPLQGAGLLLGAGLSLGAVGDALLALGSRASFLAGAGAFLLGHICYIVVFLGTGIGMRAALRAPARVAALLVLAGAGVASSAMLFTPGSPLVAPLRVYSAVLTAMAMTSFTLAWSHWVAMAGAVLFFISDGFVAYDLFRPDNVASDGVRFAGWMIYWAGQAGICVGGTGLTLTRRSP